MERKSVNDILYEHLMYLTECVKHVEWNGFEMKALTSAMLEVVKELRR